MLVEPPRSLWVLPRPDEADHHGVVGFGADLEPGTLLEAYRQGLFPMPADRNGLLAWWSPDPRGVLPLDGLVVSRSLRRSCHRYEVRIDSAFTEVVRHCAHQARDGGWITPTIIDAYARLHRLGWAHSVECWEDGRLVGGLYGIAIGGFFAGESMFHRATDASKVALVALVDQLNHIGATLLDVQWTTAHLRSLGAHDVPRAQYLRSLDQAIEQPVSWCTAPSGDRADDGGT